MKNQNQTILRHHCRSISLCYISDNIINYSAQQPATGSVQNRMICSTSIKISHTEVSHPKLLLLAELPIFAKISVFRRKKLHYLSQELLSNSTSQSFGEDQLSTKTQFCFTFNYTSSGYITWIIISACMSRDLKEQIQRYEIVTPYSYISYSDLW